MATSINQDNFVKTALRLPADLHVRLHEAAQAHGTSLNSEIIMLLQQALDNTPERLLDQIEARLRKILKE